MHLMLLYGFIFIVGLCIGSFINMAAYRIPKMLYFSWFIDSYEFLNLQPKFHKSPSLQLNLCFPSSHCPNCKKKNCGQLPINRTIICSIFAGCGL